MGTGKGQVIDVSIWEPLFAMLGPNALAYEMTGEVFKRMGSRAFTSAPRNIYVTRDKRWIAIAGSSQTTTARLFETMGQPELIKDPRFKSNEDRVKNVEAMDVIVGKWMMERDSNEVLKILNDAEVPVGPVMDVSDIMKDPHAQFREMIIQVPDEDRGKVMMEGVFPKLSLTPGVVNHSGKRLGADNEEIFAGRLGLSKEDMAELAKQKVI
jgi:crotonobetainyl-CoA:carnitine CoA-transferase CaiB-like acyl-CoA transferase